MVFTTQRTGENNDYVLEAEALIDGSSLSIDVSTDSKGNKIPTPADDLTITVLPENVDDIVSSFSSYISEVNNSVFPNGISTVQRQAIAQQVPIYEGGNASSAIENAVRFSRNTEDIGLDTSTSFSFNLPGVPVIIPSVGSLNIGQNIQDEIPPLRIRVSADPLSFADRVIGSGELDAAQTTLEIPFDKFIGTFNLDNSNCGNLYPEISSEASRLQNQFESVQAELQGRFNTIERAGNALASGTFGDDGPFDSPQQAISRIEELQESPLTMQMVDGDREEFSFTELRTFFINSSARLSDEIEESVGLGKCDFASERRTIDTNVLSDLWDQVQNFDIPESATVCADQFEEQINTLQDYGQILGVSVRDGGGEDGVLDISGSLSPDNVVDQLPSVMGQESISIDQAIGNLQTIENEIADDGCLSALGVGQDISLMTDKLRCLRDSGDEINQIKQLADAVGAQAPSLGVTNTTRNVSDPLMPRERDTLPILENNELPREFVSREIGNECVTRFRLLRAVQSIEGEIEIEGASDCLDTFSEQVNTLDRVASDLGVTVQLTSNRTIGNSIPEANLPLDADQAESLRFDTQSAIQDFDRNCADRLNISDVETIILNGLEGNVQRSCDELHPQVADELTRIKNILKLDEGGITESIINIELDTGQFSQDIRNARDVIENADLSSECEQEFNNELDGYQQELIQALGDAPCTDVHGRIDDLIIQLEKDLGLAGFAQSLSPPITTEQEVDIIDSIDFIRSEIDSRVQRSDCRRQFENRITDVRDKLREGLSEASLEAPSTSFDVSQPIHGGVLDCESVNVDLIGGVPRDPGYEAGASSLPSTVNILWEEARRASEGIDEQPLSGDPIDVNRLINVKLTGVYNSAQDNVEESACKNALLAKLADAERLALESELTLGCADIPDDLRDSINQFTTNAEDLANSSNPTTSEKDSLLSEGQNLKSRFDSEVSDSNTCKSEFMGKIDSGISTLNNITVTLDCEDVPDSLISSVDQYTQNAQNFLDKDATDRSQSTKDNLLSNADTLVEDIRNTVSTNNPCRDQLRNEVQNMESSVSDASVLEELDCTDAPTSLLNEIDTYQSDVNSFRDLQRSERTSDQKNNLLERGQNLRNRVSSNISDRNPCQDQKINQLNDILDEVRNIRTKVEAQDCSTAFPSLQDDIDNYRRTVLTANPPLSDAQIQTLISDGQAIIDSVERRIPSDNRCRNVFVTEMETLIDRVESLSTEVRVVTPGTGGDTGDQDEGDDLQREIERLQEQIRGFNVSSDFTGDGGNIPDT